MGLTEKNRIKVAPVRRRPKRVAKKIAKRFGILHHVFWDQIGDTLEQSWTVRRIDQLTPDELRGRMDVIRKDTHDLGLLVLDAEEEFSVEHRVEITALVGATVEIDQAHLVVDSDGARFDCRQKSISWNALYLGGRIIRRPDTILKIDDLDTHAGKPSVIGEPSD